MQLRFRIFMGVTALLYLGPLLAGLAGAGWGAVLAFAAVFVLWLLVLRPGQWPRSLADWGTIPALTQALTQALMQLVLVTLLFAFGRAIGGALGLRPTWPDYLPLALSLSSIPLGRLVWDPWQAADLDRFLDGALDQIQSPGGRLSGADGLRQALVLLNAMPRDLTPDQMADHLRAIEGGQGPEALWQAVQRPGDAGRQQALTVFATDGRRIEVLGGDVPTIALGLLPDDPGLLSLFASRSLAALTEDPDLWGHFPNRDRLNQRLLAMTGTPAEAPLQALIATIDRLDPDRQ